MSQFLNTEILIIELLLVVSVVAIAVRRLKIPYTVALVVVGLIITTQSEHQLELTPELILAVFVPPLIFEAAFLLNFQELRRSLVPILFLAIPGVIVTMAIVAGVLSWGIGLSLPVALTFGTIIAATDPVAVISIFRSLGAPKRLTVLIEGESLFNDGTAVVLFNIVIAFVITGELNPFLGAVEFVRVAIGGLAVGLALGWVISRLIARIDDYLIEITLTTVLAYGAYLVAEELHFSGILAVLAAGLVNGNLGTQGMSPTTRIVLLNFWEYAAFLANSLVFLLIGLKVDIPALTEAWRPIAWAIGAVVLARVVVVYGLNLISKRFAEPVSLRWQHVQAWGGLRGAISLALALSLPVAFGLERNLLLTMAFGVVLFSLLVQGTSIRGLVRRLKIVVRGPEQVEYEKRHARLVAMRSAEHHLEQQYREGLLSAHTWEMVRPNIQEQNELLAEAVRETLRAAPDLEAEELDTARREVLRAQRSAFIGLHQDGVIDDEVFEQLSAEVDAVLEGEGEAFWFVPGNSLPGRLSHRKPVDIQELTVEAGSTCAGMRVRDVSWPENFLIASLLRVEQVLIPNGETVLEAGDVLMVVASDPAFQAVRKLCRAGGG